ncbi:hypothetical protein LPJ55_004611 [Coemansia sp. RSA 990]|nr:hypothetical protein BX667DRAFT_507356 [Coemansia mojavensis]KAJ1748509.1 hypothetical protein LPJ79_004465 [Coemansia sp. RSA 1821]KAJ1870506.1 hypothetical protein LPJ55_004611 [Coemansia sp. RSA 990]
MAHLETNNTVGSDRSSSSGSKPMDTEMSDEIQLTFLVPSNERHTRTFKITDTVYNAKQMLLEDWPAELGSKPGTISEIRLLYGGNFLDNSSTLSVVKRYPDAPTVVHMMINRSKAVEKDGIVDLSYVQEAWSTYLAV